MKTITIGRDASCTICINDERISRRHALLKIHNTGKMEIVDMSSNGTYVNGIKIAKNVPFPVTRKNTVVFAHARQLDWSEVPDPTKIFKIIAVSILAVVIITILTIISLKSCSDTSTSYSDSSNIESTKRKTNVTDSTSSKSQEAPYGVSTSTSNGKKGDSVQNGAGQTTDASSKDSTKKGSTWYNRAIENGTQKRQTVAPPKKEKTNSKPAPKPGTPQEKKEGTKSNPTPIL